MFTVPFALSIHHFINSIGADVGFASIIAVALLVLLYFAHAREAASLRERLDEAQARIGGLETRLMQLLNAQAARGPAPAAGVPVAPGAGAVPAGQPRPPGAAIPSVRRIPTATAAATAVAPGAAVNGLAPLAPLGVGAPALASATRVILMPTPAAPTAPPVTPPPVLPAAPVAEHAPDLTLFIPASTNGHEQAAESNDTRVLPAAAPPAPAAPSASPAPLAPAASRPSAPGGSKPPPVRIGAGRAGRGDPADRGDDAGRSRRRPPASSLLLDDGYDDGGSGRSGRLLPLLISAVAVVAIVVALILISNSGSGSPTTGVVHHSNTTPTGASVSNPKPKAPPFSPSKVTVAVLNGTPVAGLAGDVGKVLTGDGYTQGNVTNASVQTQATTVVYYVTGAHAAANKIAAQHVASSLSLGAGSVQPAPQAALQSCATGPTGNALGSCSATVIVSVGQDRASLASSNAG